MIKAYIDYSRADVVVHLKPNCAEAKVGPNANIRHVLISADSLSRELVKFRDNKYRLSAEPGLSDIWLILDLQDSEFEKSVVRHLWHILGLHYSQFRVDEPREHC